MKVLIFTELGTEKRCSSCGEYYPFDAELFNKNGLRNGVQQWSSVCKACYVDHYRGGHAA